MRSIRTALLGVGCVFALAGAAAAQRTPSDSAFADSLPAPPPLVREFRGAWLSPVEGGAWPSRPDMSVAEQQAELRGLLDSAAAVGLNAVLLHVRIAGDALYPTTRAPWSRYLAGPRAERGAEYDGWDPLAFAVREAHARGLQLHAWFNPFRASTPDNVGPPLPGHVTRTHPAWVRRYGSAAWIDPGIPEARQSVLDAILEVVQRYDIDGVHLDDYFYPYLEQRTVTRVVRRGRKHRRVRVHHTVTLSFPDDVSWKRYGRAKGWTSRTDWRRANIDEFVRTLYQRVHEVKPWLMVGISPFGIWRPGHPPGITGLDSYSEIFADSRKWLREGWLDYLSPQLYWSLDNGQQRFTRLDAWWRTQNVKGRHIWPGLLTASIASRSAPWPEAAIAQEIDTLRGARTDSSESRGHVHFRLRSLIEPPDGTGTPTLGDVLRRDEYATPALPPASPWLGQAVPASPRVAWTSDPSAVPAGDAAEGGPAGAAAGGSAPGGGRTGAALSLAAADTVGVRWWVLQTLGDDGRWSMRIVSANTHDVPALRPGEPRPRAIAVRAISATGMASPPVILPTGPR